MFTFIGRKCGNGYAPPDFVILSPATLVEQDRAAQLKPSVCLPDWGSEGARKPRRDGHYVREAAWAQYRTRPN